MRFAEPAILNFLFLVPFLAGVFLLLMKFRRKKVRLFLDKHLESDVAPEFSRRTFVLKYVLLLGVFIFAILALARPQWGFEWQEVKHQGLDIVVAVDVSKSMLTQDVKPNRLERTKWALRDLVRKLKGDRIGLIAFSGDAFLVCPLTADMGGFLLSLEDLNVNTIPRGGTNIGRAIEESLKGYDDVPARYKAVIIVTDGENLEGDPIIWAKKAAEQKVRISTVGIGTREGELVRIPDETGEMAFIKGPDGAFIKSRLNEGLLKELAAATGGAYVRSSGAEFGLDYLYDNELSKMEKRDIESRIEQRFFERFQIPLLIALILLFIETILVARKP